jgi:LPS-assembly lipoprotein
MKKIMTLLLSLTLLTACGWQLRGSLNLPSDLQSLYIDNQSQGNVTATELGRLLKANNVALAESSENAQYTIRLTNEREQRRTVSVTSGGESSEYELTYEVDYSIANSEGILVVPGATAQVIRSYSYDRDNVIAKGQEEQLIRDEMRPQLASQILNRLRFSAQPVAAPATTEQ